MTKGPIKVADGAQSLLEDYEGQVLPWTRPPGSPVAIRTDRVLFGKERNALEVAIGYADTQPRVEDLRKLFKLRQGARPSPVLMVIAYPAHDGSSLLAAATGTKGDPAPALGLSLDRVGRLAAAALNEPDRHAAVLTIDRLLAGLKDQLTPGLVNVGLFASHELRIGVPERGDWDVSREAAEPLLGLRGQALIEALGYGTSPRGSAGVLLTDSGTNRAIAVLLDETELFDRPVARFGALSPIAYGLSAAAKEGLSWVIVLRGSQVRLYPAKTDVGVGRKGLAETYAELDLALLGGDDAAYLTLIFSPAALAPDGTVQEILASSENFAADLGARLRERIYQKVIPSLGLAVGRHTDAQGVVDLEEAYHCCLLILFRLLFLAYAEDRGLLPYGRNALYDRHAVKTLAKEFAANPDTTFDPEASGYWDDLQTLWAAVDEGNRRWDVPAYNGGLFSNDSGAGAVLAEVRLNDDEFGPVLAALLVDTDVNGDERPGPVDFRSLSVREFGTIYEGLLESNLSIAPIDLTVDATGAYAPAKGRDTVYVRSGGVYLHNASGKRKASGSYFTKQFTVEHLLDQALEPALADHLGRVAAFLKRGDDAAAADAFFDFRVADLAMGSAHFLVAAVDRIEARFSAFLTDHPIAAVLDELGRLRAAAVEALGDQTRFVEIDNIGLLRRQIARRCIYGVDLNLMAVELAKLAIWIHTFVPGLPMSALNHNLVTGNSLTGVGTIDEVLGILAPARGGQISLFEEEILKALRTARDRLLRVARTAEATKQEVRDAARAYALSLSDAEDAASLFDAAVAVRLGVIPPPTSPEGALKAVRRKEVAPAVDEINAIHFPARFPEVFLRDRNGFDCLLGNPPWETMKAEEHKFWGLRSPGLRSLSTGAMNQEIVRLRRSRPDLHQEYLAEQKKATAFRKLVMAGPYPGIGSGDPDLSEIFAWRFFQLVGPSGAFGVVLPRSVFMSAGTDKWREQLLRGGEVRELMTLTNAGGWVFDDAEHRYTIALLSYQKTGVAGDVVLLRGPYRSLQGYIAGRKGEGATLRTEDILAWTPGAGIPLLPSEAAVGVYRKMRSHPAFTSEAQPWRVRTYNELHATHDRVENCGVIDTTTEPKPGMWPVYKGESFGLWCPWTGTAYGWAKPGQAIEYLQEKRRRQVRLARSAFAGMPSAWANDPKTLPCRHPRIAWRMVARATDTRSFYAALLPPNVLSAHHNYLLFFPDSDHERDEAYILGVMCSMPFDWHARLWVEANFTASIVRPFPVPGAQRSDPVRRRVEDIAGRLAAIDDRFATWAKAVGVPVGPVLDDEREQLLPELDATVALLYGLDENDLDIIYGTFHEGADYSAYSLRVKEHHRRWAEATGRARPDTRGTTREKVRR